MEDFTLTDDEGFGSDLYFDESHSDESPFEPNSTRQDSYQNTDGTNIDNSSQHTPPADMNQTQNGDKSQAKAKVMDFFSRFKPSKRIEQPKPETDVEETILKVKKRGRPSKKDKIDATSGGSPEPTHKKAKRSYTRRNGKTSKGMSSVVTDEEGVESTTPADIHRYDTKDFQLVPINIESSQTRSLESDTSITISDGEILIQEEPAEISNVNDKNVRGTPIEIIDLEDDLIILSDGDNNEKEKAQPATRVPSVNLKDLLKGKPKEPPVGNEASREKPKRKIRETNKKKYKTVEDDVVEIFSDEEYNDLSLQESLIEITEEEKESNLRALEIKIKTSMKKTNPTRTTAMDLLRKSNDDNELNRLEKSASALSILNANRTPTIYKHPIGKLKEIEPPVIPRSELLVQPDEEEPLTHRSLDLQPKEPAHVLLDDLSPFGYIVSPFKDQHVILSEKSTLSQSEEVLSHISTIHPEFFQELIYNRLLNGLENGPLLNPSNELLTDFFKPKITDELLLPRKEVTLIKRWIKTSFQTLKKPVKRPDFSRRAKMGGEFNDFIVDDNELMINHDLIEEDDDDEVYAPLLVIHGDEGIGKTTAVYTIMKEMQGYVHEVNTGQSRGKKDILETLKELTTTQLVHNNDSKEFQKGVLLFEDVDNLFEEDDKGFWSVLQHLLQVSRRPIIVTCVDVTKVPRIFLDVLEDAAIVELKKPSTKVLSGYLYLVALNYGYELDDRLIHQIIKETKCDLRKSFMELQRIMPIQNSCGALTKLKLSKKENNSVSPVIDIHDYAKFMNYRSLTNIIHEHSHSLLDYSADTQEFQTVGVTLSEKETEKLPFELNVSNEINALIPSGLKLKFPTIKKLQELKDADYYFLGSKLKRLKRITRSVHTNPNYESTEDSEYISYLQKQRPLEFLLDTSPFIREFARYEMKVRDYNDDLRANNGQYVNKEDFLFSNFNDDPWEYLGVIYSGWK